MEATYYINNTSYAIVPEVNTESAYELVKSLVAIDEEYRDRLDGGKVKLTAVKNGEEVAWMVLENNEYETKAVMLVSNDIIALMLLYYTLWKSTLIKRIKIVPHEKGIAEYVSTATGPSLRRWHEGLAEYIIVDVQQLRNKMNNWVVRCLG